MKFLDVDPSMIPNIRESHRGRVSYPLIKTFMELNAPIKQLDRTGMQQSLQGLTSCLTAYIRNHKLPVSIFTRGGELYFVREDLLDDGSPDPDYVAPAGGKDFRTAAAELHAQADDIPAIDKAEVSKRYKEERGQTTK